MSGERIQLPDLNPERRFRRTDAERFDRIAFAVRALGVLRPDATVAVYPRSLDLRVERGRDLARGPGAEWAIVGIPPNASREYIAFALAELAGLEASPFVVDLLARL